MTRWPSLNALPWHGRVEGSQSYPHSGEEGRTNLGCIHIFNILFLVGARDSHVGFAFNFLGRTRAGGYVIQQRHLQERQTSFSDNMT
jgi:hypothetical protein